MPPLRASRHLPLFCHIPCVLDAGFAYGLRQTDLVLPSTFHLLILLLYDDYRGSFGLLLFLLYHGIHCDCFLCYPLPQPSTLTLVRFSTVVVVPLVRVVLAAGLVPRERYLVPRCCSFSGGLVERARCWFGSHYSIIVVIADGMPRCLLLLPAVIRGAVGDMDHDEDIHSVALDAAWTFNSLPSVRIIALRVRLTFRADAAVQLEGRSTLFHYGFGAFWFVTLFCAAALFLRHLAFAGAFTGVGRPRCRAALRAAGRSRPSAAAAGLAALLTVGCHYDIPRLTVAVTARDMLLVGEQLGVYACCLFVSPG